MEWSPVPLFEVRNMKEGTSALEYYVLIYCGLLVYYRWMETHLGIRIKHFSVFHYQTSPSSAREWVSAVLIRSVFLGFWEKGLGWSVQYCILIPSQTGSSLKPGRSLCDGMSFSDQLSGFQNTYPLWLSYCYPAPSQLGQPFSVWYNRLCSVNMVTSGCLPFPVFTVSSYPTPARFSPVDLVVSLIWCLSQYSVICFVS